MSWIILFFAGLFEVGWAVGLKYTDGFTKLLPTTLTVAAMVASIVLLGDSAAPLRLVCLGLIVLGIAGLKLTG